MASSIVKRQSNSFQNSPWSKKRKISSNGTCLEDLPNEIFHEIFEYLDTNDMFIGFNDLNKRFHSLIHKSELPLKVNLPLMTELNFLELHREFLIPNRHRIQILNTSNPFLVDYIFPSIKIVNKFLRLETLIINEIDPQSFLNIFHYLASLENLSKLIIISTQCLKEIYEHIFRLPKLKYCKIKFLSSAITRSISLDSKLTSSIEHIVIDGAINADDFISLPSHLPHLQTLYIRSLKNGRWLYSVDIKIPQWNHLKKVKIYETAVDFDQFELISKQTMNQIEILHLSVCYNDDRYLNAHRWEQLILSSMPKLRLFYFEDHKWFVDDTDKDYHTNYQRIRNEFSSSFWTERKWFFNYELLELILGNFEVIFYSINIKRKKYVFKQNARKFSQEKHVEHVTICHEDMMLKCNHYFPCVTQLVLSTQFCKSVAYLPNRLTNIIPVKQLTNLTINGCHLSKKQLVNLLDAMSNLQVLCCRGQSIKMDDAMDIQESELFQNVAKNNKIFHFIICHKYGFNIIEFIIPLCSQLKRLTINNCRFNYEKIIRFIINYKQTYLRKLCLLHCIDLFPLTEHKLQDFIKDNNLFKNCYSKIIENDFYIFYQ